MDKQAVFDKVVNHLLTQNDKSMNDDGMCMYRAEDGNMCAIGCLIPDNLYNSRIEKTAINSSNPLLIKIMESALDCKINNIRDLDFLTNLQCIHDNENPEDWYKELVFFAERNKLRFNA